MENSGLLSFVREKYLTLNFSIMINLAGAENLLGELLVDDKGFSLYFFAFESSGFTGNINWYGFGKKYQVVGIFCFRWNC
ncbi:hypothetical protein SAMN00777080_3461 [Aquiflexum balticum DSM 16537]|uniref:Uncharacterized protein n=1 Tax=Aquiflexum balticum DSM 16537 TaxID=758820 RepID=A0A1W2H7C0_9BACT|nr:hypothetical protein [Aquiflexum balticum]SMD44827.1 hypothetical protein SAMN00777080_3461 [Aquiflexum balticum DSM 16537]